MTTKLLLPQSTDNYTIGGGSLLFSEKSGSTYLGYVPVGAYSDVGLDLAPTFLDHFTAQSGKRVKDKTLCSELNASLTITAEEYSLQNFLYFFYGGTVSGVSAVSATATAVSLTATIGRNRDVYAMFATGTVTVTNSAGTTTYTVTTSYEVSDIYEMKQIRWVDGGAISDGATVKVVYKRKIPASEKFNVFANTDREGKAKLIFRSDAGINWAWTIPKCTIRPEGTMTPSDTDWSNFGIVLDLLEDATVAASFGYIEMFEDNVHSA